MRSVVGTFWAGLPTVVSDWPINQREKCSKRYERRHEAANFGAIIPALRFPSVVGSFKATSEAVEYGEPSAR